MGEKSLLLPDGSIKNHPWNGGDTMTYIQPAKEFIRTGTFARNGQPDMHRTIGYPFFLAITMHIFGKNWLYVTYILQIFIFALIFPASSCIAIFLFPNLNKKDGRIIFLILALSGIGLAYTGQIMTDQFFASLLIAGLACGLLAILKQSWKMAILHMLFIGYAAQVRPTLGLFFFADFFFLLYALRVWRQQVTKKRAAIISCAVLILAVSGNGPAIRNYLNHGIFTQTDVLANAFAEYLAGPVLRKKGLNKAFGKNMNEFKRLSGKEKIVSQKRFAFSIVRKYPFETVKKILYHLIWNSFETHWENIFHVYDKLSFYNESYLANFKKNIQCKIIFHLYYIFIFSIFIFSILINMKKQWYSFLLFIVFYSLPFLASFISGAGARMRIYIEPFIVMTSLSFLKSFLCKEILFTEDKTLKY